MTERTTSNACRNLPIRSIRQRIRRLLVSQGTHLVESGQRRRVDAHGFRGSSYLKIGWNWIRRALSRKEKLLNHLALSPKPDPEPAMASRKQHYERTQPRFLIELRHAA